MCRETRKHGFEAEVRGATLSSTATSSATRAGHTLCPTSRGETVCRSGSTGATGHCMTMPASWCVSACTRRALPKSSGGCNGFPLPQGNPRQPATPHLISGANVIAAHGIYKRQVGFNPRPTSSAGRTPRYLYARIAYDVSIHAPPHQRGEPLVTCIGFRIGHVSIHAPPHQRGELELRAVSVIVLEFQSTPHLISGANPDAQPFCT